MGMEQIHEVMSRIDGQAIVGDLLELAAIGGKKLEPTADHPVHFATNRPALSEKDRIARGTFIAPRMRDAGMDVLDDHPLALIGIHNGTNPNLDPVVIMSHIDTVPDGDIYDGTLGVLGGIEVVKAIKSEGVQTERDIMVVSVSGEESAPFGIALFGSRSLFQGMNDAELDSRKDGDQSIREALGEEGVKFALQPVFGPNGDDLPTPHAVIELHVEQDRKLMSAGIDLGVVENIATPARYRASVGETSLETDNTPYAYERYFAFSVQGRADHSGATPMGAEYRADGLLETVNFVGDLLKAQGDEPTLTVGDIQVEKSAMNKIPGRTTTTLRIASNNEREVEESYQQLQAALEKRTNYHADAPGHFPPNPLELQQIKKEDAGVFFEPAEITARQQAAFRLVKSVNLAANGYASENVVGTVASFTTSAEGAISLEVDIRGIELRSRERAIQQIQRDLQVSAMDGSAEVDLGDVLPGSGDAPVAMDPGLVHRVMDVVHNLRIGSVRRMFSAAGHDTQNAARAGIPSVMLFAQSKDGIAHNPEAYTSPANIQKSVRALAALTLWLANET